MSLDGFPVDALPPEPRHMRDANMLMLILGYADISWIIRCVLCICGIDSSL
jgi:hypothetical protein